MPPPFPCCATAAPPRVRTIAFGLFALLLIIANVVFALWYGVNSDRDNVPPLLNQLIPAGHCKCASSTVFQCAACLDAPRHAPVVDRGRQWSYIYGRDDRNEGLSGAQCAAAFPGLFTDPERASSYWIERGGVSLQKLDAIPLRKSMARAAIFNGELYVLATRAGTKDHRRKIVATLSSMHRALVAMADRSQIPDIEFVFSVEDKAEDVVGKGHPIWVFSRKTSEEYLWLLPDFGYWAWAHIMNDPDNDIGPYSKVVSTIINDEDGAAAFTNKTQKLVWRGKLSFAPKLRRSLLEASRGKSWSDVRPMAWSTHDGFITMGDHCKYAFIAHLEGRSYSGSLKYRQACRSVVVVHKLQWIQHHHYLMVAEGRHQNYVEVERDFSDLNTKMEALIADPANAQRIADNSVKTFRERYLTQAAEACYWRRLWALWNDASVGYRTTGPRGLRYESFVLLESDEMMHFSYP